MIAMGRFLFAATVALVFVLGASAARADQLQFKIAVSGGASYASFAEVQLIDAQHRQAFRGYTDRFGRINVPLSPGKYQAVVITSGQKKTKMVELTGASKLRLVMLE